LKLAPGTTIVTEIEQIARIYPYDSPDELQVKSVVNYLIEDLTFDQITRLQKVTESMISGRLDATSYLRSLMTDFEEGGVGIPVARATEMTQRLSDIMVHSRDIQRFRRPPRANSTQIHDLEFVNRIAEFVAGQCDLRMDPGQKINFETSIAQRIGGFTRKDEFAMQMNLAIAEGGVGLSKKQAFDAGRLIEKLIALGIPRTGEAHH
jgi:hypothetical protein